MIKEFIISTVLKETYSWLKKHLRKQKTNLLIQYSDYENILDKQIRYIINWCSEISFMDTFQKKDTIKTYVNLDYYLTPKRAHFSTEEKDKTKTLLEILDAESHNLIFLGDPGAGKTTTLKYIAYKILYDDTFFQNRYKFPLIIRLKEINEKATLIEKLANQLGIYIETPKSEIQINKYEILLTSITNTINLLQCLVLLDGFDEIQSQSLKNEVLTDIDNLSSNLDETRIILTCRSADFYYNVSNFGIYEIKPLEEKQVKLFINNWLKNTAKSKILIRKIYSSSYQYYSLKPLTLAHLCAIYERTETIPERPILLYKKYTELLLSEWDKQNRVKRESKYNNFDNETKLCFLSHLSYLSKIQYGVDYFEKNKLLKIYEEICQQYALPTKDALSVVNEIENHTGLFFQTGYNTFEFEHKTLQEYITSEYLVKNFDAITQESIYKLPNELAAGLLLVDSPADLFMKVLSKIGFPKMYNEFFEDKRIERYIYTLDNYPTLIKGGRRIIDDHRRYSERTLTVSELPISTYQYDFFNTFISRMSTEKPDFESNLSSIFWLLGIYTIGSLFKEGSSQLELFSLNTNLYIESLFQEHFFVDQIKNIESYYRIGLSKRKRGDLNQPKIERDYVPYILRKNKRGSFLLPKFIYLPTQLSSI
jgi:hypothetical protein